MKSYNGLFARMTEREEIEASIVEASKYKKDRPIVARILARKTEKAEEIREKVVGGKWTPPRHETHLLREGAHKKERQIQKPRFDDEQIVHHMLMRQLRPIVQGRLYRYACGSLPGRGTHYAAKTMKRWRDSYGGRRFYVFEGDIHHFYDSIDTERLKKKLRRRIRDRQYLEELFKVIDVAAPGLPKGFYTSPWLANLFMEEFDNFVVQELKPDHYLRYMDNLFIFHKNKKELHRMVRSVSAYLADRLGLQLKGDWQLYRFEGRNRRNGKLAGRAVNALGFVIHSDRVTIRKAILKRIRAKANHIHQRRRYTRHDCASMVSRMGAFQHANAYKYYLRWIKPKVSIHYCKRRLSRLAKKRSESK